MWGAVHLIPVEWPHWLIRSVFFGLIVSTVHCAIVFPAQDGGMYGTKYGKYTAILVYLTDAAWAVTSGAAFFNLREWFTPRHRRELASAAAHSRPVNINYADASNPLLPRYV